MAAVGRRHLGPVAGVAWAAFALQVAILVASAALDPIGRDRPPGFESGLLNVYSVSIVAFGLLGALIATRHPENRLALVFAAIALVHSLGYLFASIAGALLSGPGAGSPLTALFAWAFVWSANLHYVPSATFVFLLFPDGRLPSRRWRPLVGLTLASIAGLVVGTATLPGPLVVFTMIENPFGVPGELPVAIAGISFVVGGCCALASVASLFVRYRRASGDQRQQIKWILYAGGLIVVLFAAVIGLGLNIVSAALLMSVATIVLATAAGVAIFRYHLYEIDGLIDRTLVYGSLSIALVATYAVAVIALQAVLAPLTAGSDLAVAASTLLVVALFQPLRARVQRAVDRRFYRGRYDAQRTLDAFAARLRDEVDLAAVADGFLDAVDVTLRPSHASIWLRPADTDARNAPVTPRP